MTRSLQPWVSGGAAVADAEARQLTVTTSDGRTLGVAEYGPADGLPVFQLHGTPGSRYGGPPPDDPGLFDRFAMRAIGYDRPGYGRSTRHAGRRVVDAVTDVQVIADHLGLAEFAVTGGSGGGPHCLAVAARLRDRVTRAACVVGAAPMGEPGLAPDRWLDGMTVGNVKEFSWAIEGEATLRPHLEQLATKELVRALDDPSKIFGDDYELAEGDQEILADPRRHARIVRSVQEAYRTGVDGWIDDNLQFVQAWGFDVAEIRRPTMVWFGTEDTLVPAAHGEWLAQHVPKALVLRMSGGHMELAHREEELVRWLTGGDLPTGTVHPDGSPAR
jgi:pimeloyl-ACP methyl ester carboxylesterase